MTAQLTIFDELLRVQTAPECRYCNGKMTPAPDRKPLKKTPAWAQNAWECLNDSKHVGLFEWWTGGFVPASQPCKIYYSRYEEKWRNSDGAEWESDPPKVEPMDMGQYMKNPNCLFMPTCMCGLSMNEATLGLWFCPKHKEHSLTVYASSICYYTPDRCCPELGHKTPMPVYSGVDSI